MADASVRDETLATDRNFDDTWFDIKSPVQLRDSTLICITHLSIYFSNVLIFPRLFIMPKRAFKGLSFLQLVSYFTYSDSLIRVFLARSCGVCQISRLVNV